MNRVQQFVVLAMTPCLVVEQRSAGNTAERGLPLFTQVLRQRTSA